MNSNDIATLGADLQTGAAELGLTLTPVQRERLLALMALLARWNRAYNLTAIETPRQMLGKHLLDSLSVQPYLQGERLLDVGTGGGFPGLPLAIVNPHCEFVLLDSHAKKLRFIRQAAAELGLANVETVHARVEDYRPAALFDCITSRAFASLSRFVEWSGGLLAPAGRLVAMKGHIDAAEQSEVAACWRLETHPVVVPFVDAVRHIVVIRRV